ncbi:sulfur carrier protein ThiS adenylyltransferase ThiF [Desulfogranum mediterraneum]|uniref:sulfur carrier protein ThiS adenylyltransferase ThiF n=1 Tax=Desulfogranum mediterraneum TaxID=160661 RepID=UPI000410379E|nr:sulfur carrier protein ThiS adenylyltransferase ThiF [Desulfogranum mediterraneum]
MMIGIAGAGGIGSNVAVNLVRSGVTCLKIVDFDRIEPSNLNRQFYFADQVGGLKVETLARNLTRINPEVEITTVVETITPANIESLFADCDPIVEGLDNGDDKKMILEQFSSGKSLVVSASGIAGLEVDTITSRRLGNCHIVGDMVSDCSTNRLYAHKVLAVAARMTAILLQHGTQHE